MSNNKNITITINLSDVRTYRIRTDVETIDLFGNEYLFDYGINIPIELLNEYKAIMLLYGSLQDKLEALYEKRLDSI